jgi:ubiquinone/menaquinone biosynthesis C-methylase UbiE
MSAPDFDGIARAYRWLEYLSLGPLLQRTRTCHLALLRDRRHALVLGDGDGRFTARLLATCPAIQVDAVDLSGRMLSLLRDRCRTDADRLRIHRADARRFVPPARPDLVATHFFLDCLPQAEVDALVGRIAPLLAPGALWVVSDFRIPAGALGWVARVYVRTLYLAFRVLTGLRTTQLPDHAAALERCGLVRIAQRRAMLGMLTSEVWRLQQQGVVEPLQNTSFWRSQNLCSGCFFFSSCELRTLTRHCEDNPTTEILAAPE